MATRKFVCLVYGTKDEFTVRCSSGTTIHELKKLILEKLRNCNDFKPIQVNLYNVHFADATAASKYKLNADGNKPLRGGDEITAIFPESKQGYIDIIVVLPYQTDRPKLFAASLSEFISKPKDDITPRTEMVKNLYYRLKENKVIHVKGTPYIGKTTLLKLLYFHIKEVEPEMTCAKIIAWPKSDVQDAGEWREYIYRETGGRIVTDQSTPFVLFIDEAQGTYWDEDLWTDFVKELAQGSWHSSEHYLIMFSYCGLHASTLPEIPVNLTEQQTVTLLPSPKTEKSFPVCLLLNREEFNDALYRALAKPAHGAGAFIDKEVEDALFTVTQGHAGALRCLIDFFYWHPQTLDMITRKKTLTMAFLEEHLFSNFSEMFKFLLQHGITRGLPGPDDITQPEITKIFEIILTENRLIIPRTLPPEEIAAFQVCYRSGWIQAEIDYRSKSQTTYVMASKLHEWYMRLLLFSVCDTLSWSIPYAAPIELVIRVIEKFRPSQLQAGTARMEMQMESEVMGAGGYYRPLETVFQDEFYRCLYQVCSGHIVAVPEFGNSTGRIDFFIPKVKWGIEIMRFGLKQAEHIQRFNANGQYGPWVRTAQMTQYVIVNFTTTMPVKSNGIEHLYHVVFTEDYRYAEVIKDRGLTWIAKKVRLMEV